MNVEIGTEAAQIPEKKYIIGISVCSVGFSLDAQNMLLTIQNNLQRLLFCGANPFVAVFTLPFKPYCPREGDLGSRNISKF